MTAEEAIYGRLKNDLTLRRYVGTRIYQERPKADDTFPLIVFVREGTETLPSFNSGPLMPAARYAVETWADTVTIRGTIAARIATLLDCYSDYANGIHGMFLDDESALEIQDAPLFAWSQSFRIFAGEAP